jgi:hypothetical protein
MANGNYKVTKISNVDKRSLVNPHKEYFTRNAIFLWMIYCDTLAEIMDDLRNFLVTIFHSSEKNNGAIHHALKMLGYKRSFVRDGESYDLPENMFIRKAKGDNPQEIQDEEMQSVTQLLKEKSIEHGELGFFVGDDWTEVVSVEG